jgi:hypothetical protein
VKIYIGEIPEIFGYGINATGSTEARCRSAIRSEYMTRKRQYQYDKSFPEAWEYFGGSIFEVEIGKAYFGGFGND